MSDCLGFLRLACKPDINVARINLQKRQSVTQMEKRRSIGPSIGQSAENARPSKDRSV
ncbi:unnamed protein product [Protopolystoma xenopodis]|uniref:Uncharacterized protein n=1 Tax=Protopolystoma xenopodis TaxID=117903 RepID=A0A448WL51_9PLAT|nr:unnamed protein product [Protopolystoma xenopodis]